MAVNIAGRQLAGPGLAREMLGILHEYGLPGSALTAELTETAPLLDSAVARSELQQLRAAGMAVLADDFGVGWSNLTRLLELPLSGLKLDRALVTAMIGDPVRDHMVDAAVTLATTMGLDVTAEGVETEPVRDRLLQLGCRHGQGWLFGAAVPAAEITALLTRRPRPDPLPSPPQIDPVAADRDPVRAAVPFVPAASSAAAAAALESDLADLECSRYSDRRGVAARARQLLRTAHQYGLTAVAGRAELLLADEAAHGVDITAAVQTARLVLLRARARGQLTVAACSEAVIAWSLDRMGAKGDALSHAVEAVRLLPADAPPHLGVDHRLLLALLNSQQTSDGSYVGVFDRVLTDADRLGNPHLLLSVLNDYAWTLWKHGQVSAAVPLIQRLQAVAAAAAIPLNSTTLDTIASVLLDSGDLDGAETAGRLMTDPTTPEAEVRAAPEALLTVARIAHRRGDLDGALTLTRQAEQVAGRRELPEITAMATADKARLLAQTGDYQGAYQAMSFSHATWVRVRDRDADARAASLHALHDTELGRFATEPSGPRVAASEDAADRTAFTGPTSRLRPHGRCG